MIFRKQLINVHDPARGVYGDCHRTAMACILGLEPEEVPHFSARYWDDALGFNQAIDEWLKHRGLAQINIPLATDLDILLNQMELVNPGSVYLLGGGGTRHGVNHTVVAGNGRILWDPSPCNLGINKPMGDGLYWITIFVPLFHYLRKDIT